MRPNVKLPPACTRFNWGTAVSNSVQCYHNGQKTKTPLVDVHLISICSHHNKTVLVHLALRARSSVSGLAFQLVSIWLARHRQCIIKKRERALWRIVALEKNSEEARLKCLGSNASEKQLIGLPLLSELQFHPFTSVQPTL